jgi:hypothetical protein
MFPLYSLFPTVTASKMRIIYRSIILASKKGKRVERRVLSEEYTNLARTAGR